MIPYRELFTMNFPSDSWFIGNSLPFFIEPTADNAIKLYNFLEYQQLANMYERHGYGHQMPKTIVRTNELLCVQTGDLNEPFFLEDHQIDTHILINYN